MALEISLVTRSLKSNRTLLNVEPFITARPRPRTKARIREVVTPITGGISIVIYGSITAAPNCEFAPNDGSFTSTSG